MYLKMDGLEQIIINPGLCIYICLEIYCAYRDCICTYTGSIISIRNTA